jgi:hypothetical protein
MNEISKDDYIIFNEVMDKLMINNKSNGTNSEFLYKSIIFIISIIVLIVLYYIYQKKDKNYEKCKTNECIIQNNEKLFNNNFYDKRFF